MDRTINDYVCEEIRRIRRKRGISVEALAAKAGLPMGSYSCLENGHYRLSLENVFRITQALGVDIMTVWPPYARKPPESVTPGFLADRVEAGRRRRSALITINDVIEAVCVVFGVTPEGLKSPSRQRNLAAARTTAALLVRNIPHLTLSSLAGQLGRDVSSMSHTLGRYKPNRERRRDIRVARAILRGKGGKGFRL